MRTSLLMIALLFTSVLLTATDDQGKKQPRSTKKQGWIGVGIQDVTPKFAREEHLKLKEGAYINEVLEDSPADSAGIKEGDIIVEFNGTSIETAEDLVNVVRSTMPGTKVALKVNREGENKSLSVNVRKNTKRTPFAVIAPRAPRMAMNMFGGEVEGMDLMELNKQLAEYFEVPVGKGVLVKSIEKDKSAAKAGIKAGDVITRAGGETISDINDLYDVFSESKEGEKVSVDLVRKGKNVTVSLEITEQDEDDDRGFWWHHVPESFNFQFEPQMDRLYDEIEMKMRELPKRHKELIRRESKLKNTEV
ncbi:MAG: PDZ domain-containing protein [Bacteroidetes bacterium]|nr:PDZ domain-containing protein [Bacteroidota bacterium]